MFYLNFYRKISVKQNIRMICVPLILCHKFQAYKGNNYLIVQQSSDLIECQQTLFQLSQVRKNSFYYMINRLLSRHYIRQKVEKYKKWIITGTLISFFSIGTYLVYSLKYAHENDLQNIKNNEENIEHNISMSEVENSLASDNITVEEVLPESVPYVIIGAGTASFAAVRSIRTKNPTAKILVIGSESYDPYMRPPLSKELWYPENNSTAENLMFKQWNEKERSLFLEHKDFYCPLKHLMSKESGGVALLKNTYVKKLDVFQKIIYLEDGRKLTYDKCLIATGGTPRQLPCLQQAPKEVLEKVSYFRTIDDFRKLHAILKTAKNIAIIGGSFLGSELASSLIHRDNNLKISQIYKEEGNLTKILPSYLSRWATERLKKSGINIIPCSNVISAHVEDNQLILTLNSGNKINCDYLIVAIGIIPNIEIATSSNLEIDKHIGGISANAELNACNNVWVAGDVLSFYDIHLSQRYRIEHHDHAVLSGRHAGENMTGSAKPYTKIPMLWSDLGPDIGFEAAGIINTELETIGYFALETENELKFDHKILREKHKSDDLDELIKLFHLYSN